MNTEVRQIAPLTPMIGKLVRLLGSDQDHEALGAARAIRKVLRSAKLDLHDLANLIEARANNQTYRGARPTTMQRYHAVSVMLLACREHAELLTSMELAFVEIMTTWHRHRHEGSRLSSRQFARLSAIYERLLEGGHTS